MMESAGLAGIKFAGPLKRASTCGSRIGQNGFSGFWNNFALPHEVMSPRENLAVMLKSSIAMSWSWAQIFPKCEYVMGVKLRSKSEAQGERGRKKEAPTQGHITEATDGLVLQDQITSLEMDFRCYFKTIHSRRTQGQNVCLSSHAPLVRWVCPMGC